ncbi:MAG: hypothetical protein HQK55_17150 [Deltaproteobacteria bacterium]|nr:hypothetical protein [Deltaproteobacteria bacterium]
MNLSEGLARGSGRSVKGFNLYKALDQCRETMLRFGGHEQAAGLTLALEQLEALTEAFEEVGRQEDIQPDRESILDIETEVTLDELNNNLVGELSNLAPFGEGNPEPVFAIHGLTTLSAGCVGGAGRHLKLCVQQNGRIMDLMGFGLGHLLPDLGRQVAVAVQRHTVAAQGRIATSWKMVDAKKENA